MDLLWFVHGGTIPVHQEFLAPSRGSGPSVAPRLAGALGNTDRVRGLCEAHALLVQWPHVLVAPGLAHQLLRRIPGPVERPAALPTAPLVSMALAHLVLLVVGQVLQRSLELAHLAALARGALDLYDARTGQRAGPTARKVPESNSVLTLRASSAVPVRDETREVSLCPSGFGFPGDVQVRAKTRSFASGVLDPSVAGVRLPRVNN